MWYLSYLTPFFSLFPPLGSLTPGYVIKDAVEENYDTDHDSWLLNMQSGGSATDAVPSLALNYHCKKYQIIYKCVYSYLCTCMRNKYSCKTEFTWNVYIQVMLKVISISVLCLVHKINAQSAEWIDLIGNPISASRLISRYNILPMEHV